VITNNANLRQFSYKKAQQRSQPPTMTRYQTNRQTDGSGDWENPPPPRWMRPKRRRSGCSLTGCGLILLILIPIIAILALYLLAPLTTNVLVLGIDYTDPWNYVARTDTIMFLSVNPLKPKVAMLSIPRDLWVSIPGFGENRINTAHFFAEAQEAGSGPQKAMETVRQNFGLGVGYYLRIRFEGFKEVINAMGGVDIDLKEPMAGYPAGRHHLTGNKALAFARSRMGSDDFFRMQQGQIIIKSALRQMLNPLKWPRIPAVTLALLRSVDTNLPSWQYPRLGLALLRAGPDGIDNRTIQREMVTPYTTDQGANVLLPDWNQINPLLTEMFGK
jgi:LCP family protein required for cell wall assembly